MASVSVDASEVKALARALVRAGPRVESAAARIVSLTGNRVVASAQVNAPVDTGNLAGSISMDLDGTAFEAGPTAFYGGYVEEGTDGPYAIPNAFGWGVTVMHPGNTPRPYLGPAFDAHEHRVDEALGQAGANIL